MQTVKFVTKENDKAICWCTTNDLVYDFYRVATEQYGMRKRTFEERMNGVQTGKWSKYTKEELKVL